MKSFTPVYVPVGVPTFHLESAQRQFELSAGLLRSIVTGVSSSSAVRFGAAGEEVSRSFWESICA